MTNRRPDERGTDRGPLPRSPGERALQEELRRETKEGSDAIGDTAANRNVTGSSTWETLPEGSASDEPAAAPNEEQRHAAEEIAERLRRRGVRLLGNESGDQLADLLDAVERFEAVVVRRGGDLMIDEPVDASPPIAPDDGDFVLPERDPNDSVAAFIERIAKAGARAARLHPEG